MFGLLAKPYIFLYIIYILQKIHNMNNQNKTYFNKIKKFVLFLLLFQFSVANSSTISSHSKYFTLSGKVLDENKKPIQGVSVKSNKSSQEATTDENGSFSITDVEINEELIFNSRNYEIQLIKIESKGEMTVILKQNIQDEVVTEAEIPPVFPGGMNGLIKYLKRHIQYPEIAQKYHIQGTVYVSFIVGRDGKIREVIILRGIGGGCEEEAVRVVKSMPKWIPGKQDGRLVSCKFALPVSFSL